MTCLGTWQVESFQAKPAARTWLYVPLFTPTLLKELRRSVVKEADHTIWHVPRGLVSKINNLFTDRILQSSPEDIP